MKKEMVEVLKDMLELKQEWLSDLKARRRALNLPPDSSSDTKLMYEIELDTLDRNIDSTIVTIKMMKEDIESIEKVKANTVEEMYKKKGVKHGSKSRSKSRSENKWNGRHDAD